MSVELALLSGKHILFFFLLERIIKHKVVTDWTNASLTFDWCPLVSKTNKLDRCLEMRQMHLWFCWDLMRQMQQTYVNLYEVAL